MSWFLQSSCIRWRRVLCALALGGGLLLGGAGRANAQDAVQPAPAQPDAAGQPAAQAPAPAAPPVPAQETSTISQGGLIHGLVKSGNMPIPGVTVTAVNTLTGQKATGWTDVDGQYSLQVPADGRYVVKAQMAAFAPLTQEILINATNRNASADLEMVLLSRAQQAQPTDAQKQMAALGAIAAAVGNGRGFQSLSVTQSEGSEGAGGMDQIAPAGMPVPGISPDSATESVAVSGNTSNPMGNMSGDEFRARINEFREQSGIGGPGGLGGLGNGSLGGLGAPGGGGPGGPGGFGGGGGGFGGGGGPGILVLPRNGRFDINRPHGTAYYSVGDSAFDAAPFSLTGQPSTKPSFLQNRFGVSLGGPLNIPHIYKGGTKTFFFVNYNGTRNENPYDAFSTVPTLLERAGDFSQTTVTERDANGEASRVPVQLFNPGTTQPIAGNNLANASQPLSPVALGLLQYIPLPNLATQPGTEQNFHYVTSVNNDSDDLNIRLNHTFGPAPTLGRRGAGGGRRAPRNNLSVGVHYHGSDANVTNPFPSVAGNTSVRSLDIPVSYTRSFGKLTNIFRVDYNRNRIRTQNLYAFSQDITGGLGIDGVSTNPFDWGLPNLSFTNFGSLTDTNPLLQRNQTITFTDNMIWNHGKHTWRWGGDFRRIQLNNETDNNARGSFVFSGANTAEMTANNTQVPGTGFDFADFLLGLPQQTSVQFGANNYHFRGNSWDLYAQDEWKLRGNLTLNLGIRYEYISPFSETDDRIANLLLSPSAVTGAPGAFTAIAVQPGQGVSGTLVHPDRNNFAPRIGLAWKPFRNTVVRAGYGINYNTGAYQSIAQDLAFQPPFATTETNVQDEAGSLTLQKGFPSVNGLTTNSYAVDPNYRLGYVQIRNIDIQQQLKPTLILNLDYTGTKGNDLDNILAPNSILSTNGVPATPPIGNAQPFTWQTSRAYSSANAGSVRLRKRLHNGISIGGTYTFSKSIDNASTIGNGVGVATLGGPSVGSNLIAQNPYDLAAERGLSSFDRRHYFVADYLYELPFGHDHRWLSHNSPWRAVFGDWSWSGDWTIASGLPFTPRVITTSDVSRGAYGAVRADVVPGVSETVSDPSIAEWFNTAAFAIPTEYGDARRNSIEGPGELLFDMSFNKVIPLKESRNLELRATASNVFNHPIFSSIDTVVNSPTFGRVVSVSSMRTLQLTARFRF